MSTHPKDDMIPAPLGREPMGAFTKIFEDNSHSDWNETSIATKTIAPPKKIGSPASKWSRRLRVRETPLVLQELQGPSPQLPHLNRKAAPSYGKRLVKADIVELAPRPPSETCQIPATLSPPSRQTSSPTRRRHLKRMTFPHKLFNLLESGLYPNVIRWTNCRQSFCILERHALEERVLPESGFNLSKIRSFQRQLSLWGFSRSKGGIVDPHKEGRNKEWQPEVWEHPHFVQGMHRDGLYDIVRVLGTKTKEKTLDKRKTTTTPMPVTPEPTSVVRRVRCNGRVTKTRPKKKSVARRAKASQAKSPKKKAKIPKKSTKTKTKGALTKNMITDDHRPFFPSLFDDCADDDIFLLPPSSLQRRISCQESDFDQALQLLATPPDLVRDDSCSSDFFMKSFDGDFLLSFPIQETVDEYLTVADLELIEQV